MKILFFFLPLISFSVGFLDVAQSGFQNLQQNQNVAQTAPSTYPTDPIKAHLYDVFNMFTDGQNHAIFHVHGVLQSQFDGAVATLWLYWRSTALFANTRGFVTAADNRTELTDCISSFDDVIAKVINHLNDEVMRSIFDVRHSVTQIEIHLSSQFDVLKDIITRATNTVCLSRLPLNEAALQAAYRNFILFLNVRFSEATTRTFLDYNARFMNDLGAAVRQLVALRSSIMTARTHAELNEFIRTYCRPAVFNRFETLIDSANSVVQDCFKKIYDTLDEAAEKLPTNPIPFLWQLQTCL